MIGYRMRLILASNGTDIQAFDQDAWAQTFNYSRRDPKTSLETFRVLRENNLQAPEYPCLAIHGRTMASTRSAEKRPWTIS